MKDLYKINKEHLENNPATKRINVFLTKDQYKKLLDLKYKYRLGFGYITRIITQYYKSLRPIDEIIQDKPMYDTQKGHKTSIKINDTVTYKAKEYNNALVLFLDKLDKQFLDKKIYEKLHNNINNQFSLTIDPLWDYNGFVRKTYLMRKFEKQ